MPNGTQLIGTKKTERNLKELSIKPKFTQSEDASRAFTSVLVSGALSDSKTQFGNT